MHQQLIFQDNKKIKYAIFAVALLIFPLSMLDFSIVNDEFVFKFSFDFVIMIPAILLGLCPFITLKSQHYLNIPFITCWVLCFLRFGKVSLLGAKIPFNSYIISAFFMLGAFFTSFLLYFIAEGKIRSKLGLIIWPVILMVLTLCSFIFGLPPFVAYDEIVEGNICFGISKAVAFVLLYTEPILIACGLKKDGISLEMPKKSDRKNKEKEDKKSQGK